MRASTARAGSGLSNATDALSSTSVVAATAGTVFERIGSLDQGDIGAVLRAATESAI